MTLFNPELRRNLWLALTTHRLLAAPLVIALCAALIMAASEKNALENLASAAATGFAAMVLLWGTQLAGASVMEEARDRTWDAQRMSAIGPWAMTWGKLLGAPAFAWYGGGILLVIYLAAGGATGKWPVLRTSALMVGGAILLHAIALNASVLAARKGVNYRSGGVLIFLVLLMVMVGPGTMVMNDIDKPVRWWGQSVTRLNFLLGTATAFAAWALLGAYRSMCNALEIRTTPWALPAFILFAAVYFAGFAMRSNNSDPRALFGIFACGVVIAGGFTYLLLLAEKSGATTWQRLRVRADAAQWRRALQELPLWLVALTSGFVFATGATLTSPGGGGTFLRDVGLAPIAVILFALRDAAIFQFFALARQPRRVEAATVFYLVLLYGILPGLLRAAGAELLADLVLPPLFTNPVLATGIMLVQAVAASALAYWRWHTTHAADSAMKDK